MPRAKAAVYRWNKQTAGSERQVGGTPCLLGLRDTFLNEFLPPLRNNLLKFNTLILNKNKITSFILGVLFLTAVLIWLAIFQTAPFASIISGLSNQEKLKIIFFDVGQGAAIFIEAPNKNQILIDGGPGSQILNKLGNEMPFFDRSIDLVILTHPDNDHLNGLIDVLRNYEVWQIIDPCLKDSSFVYQEWLRLIEEKKISRICAQVGQKIKLAENIELNVLYPLESLEGQSFKNTNISSIVMKLIYGKSKIFLTGDAEESVEYQLVRNGTDLKSQILQVAHHGSKTSTSQEFISSVSPEIAIIQVGKNNQYKHPHQEVLDRLTGIKIYRSDLDSDIKFLCDLEKCIVRR